MDDDRRERCCVGRCREPVALIYLGDGFCDLHWQEKCAAEAAARQESERAATLARQQALFRGR